MWDQKLAVLFPDPGDPSKTTRETKSACKSKEHLFKLELGSSVCPTQWYDWRVSSLGGVGFFVCLFFYHSRGWG